MRGESITFSYLGGIADSGLGGIPLIPLGRWLLGLSVVLFAAGIFLGGKRKIALLEQVRFGSRRHWWNAQFGGLLFCGAAACLFYECVIQGADTLLHLPWPEEMDGGLVLILWLVHMETLVGAFGLLDITKFGRFAPADFEIYVRNLGHVCAEQQSEGGGWIFSGGGACFGGDDASGDLENGDGAGGEGKQGLKQILASQMHR